MKILKVLPIAIAPTIMMIYGWILGQHHQSGYDVAGILLFATGGIGLVLAAGFCFLSRKYSWHGLWYVNILYGIIGCGVIFLLVLLFARLHG
jgi:hypothetical protein